MKAAFLRFISGQNARDRAAVAAVLVDSEDFVLTQSTGSVTWGSRQALDAFQAAWQGPWNLEPQVKDLRIAGVTSGVAVLVTPLLFTHGEPSGMTSTVPERWSGVFVKTNGTWRLASVFITSLR